MSRRTIFAKLRNKFMNTYANYELVKKARVKLNDDAENAGEMVTLDDPSASSVIALYSARPLRDVEMSVPTSPPARGVAGV